MKLSRVFGWSLTVLFATQSWGALPPVQSPPQKILIHTGAMIGGVAGKGFTLLGVEKTLSSNNHVERIIFDVGNLEGKPHKGWPGYYHVELRAQPRQLVVDFSQMPLSKVDGSILAKTMSGSNYVSKTNILSDPLDRTMTVVLDLKREARVKVYQVAGLKQTSRVVVDLF